MKNFLNSKLFTLIVILISIILGVITLKYYWSWFISPVFNIGDISFIQALGLNLVILFIKKDQNYNYEISSNRNRAINSILSSIILLILGYIVSSFM